MNSRIHAGLSIAGIVAVVLAVGGSVSAQDPGVGSVEAVQKNLYGTPPNAAQKPKHAGDPVAFKELLETLKDSGARVKFIDGSKLTIGAKSSILVDEFVFDPKGAGGGVNDNALISISTGALRYVTGSMPKGKTVIETPTATLTLRGTTVRVSVDAAGNTHLIVDDGNVDTQAKKKDEAKNIPAGDDVFISDEGIRDGDGADTGDSTVDHGNQTGGRDDTGDHGIGNSRGGDSGSHDEDSGSGGGYSGTGGN